MYGCRSWMQPQKLMAMFRLRWFSLGDFHKLNLPTLSVIMTLRGEGVGGMTLIFY